MDRKKFITGLMAFGATPALTGTALNILPSHAADDTQCCTSPRAEPYNESQLSLDL